MRGLWTNLDQDWRRGHAPGEPGRDRCIRDRDCLHSLIVIGGPWASLEAVVAALVMAVIPNHVRESHHVLADVPTAT